MITAKEKANEIATQMLRAMSINPNTTHFYKEECKQCALVAVDEIINVLAELEKGEYVPDSLFKEWYTIKKEIDLL